MDYGPSNATAILVAMLCFLVVVLCLRLGLLHLS